MCGRFALNSTPRRIAAHFRLHTDQFELFPRYNIAPTQPVMIVRENTYTKEREMTHVVWGLIPSWAKDVAIGQRMINARSESAATKQGYRGAMKYRRCLVPADGFYEWKKAEKKGPKQPYFIHKRDGELLGLAGLWEHWQGPGGEEVESCTILTTEPNEAMSALHDRMPVILSPDDYDRWLSTKIEEPEDVRDLMKPCPAEWLALRAVGTFVNSARNEGEQCLAPPAAAAPEEPKREDSQGTLFS
jgi:putative SOS response-associated peptidase YedK